MSQQEYAPSPRAVITWHEPLREKPERGHFSVRLCHEHTGDVLQRLHVIDAQDAAVVGEDEILLNRGLEAVVPAMIAVAFYGSLGGFVVQVVLGGTAGVLAARIGAPDRRRAWIRCVTFSVLASLAGVLMLSILDRLIGPW